MILPLELLNTIMMHQTDTNENIYAFFFGKFYDNCLLQFQMHMALNARKQNIINIYDKYNKYL